MAQEIYLIDEGNELKNKLTELFKKEVDYKFKKAKTTQIETVLKNIPSLIIINEDGIKEVIKLDKMKIIILLLLLLFLLIKRKSIELKFCKLV